MADSTLPHTTHVEPESESISGDHLPEAEPVAKTGRGSSPTIAPASPDRAHRLVRYRAPAGRSPRASGEHRRIAAVVRGRGAHSRLSQGTPHSLTHWRVRGLQLK